MPLAIRYVSHLEEVVAPAVEFLERDRDLFAQPRIVVPTAGAKAWLWSELARRLGQSGGATGRGDGIVAHVELAYPGTILSLLQPARGREPDPWSFDRLTCALLHVNATTDTRPTRRLRSVADAPYRVTVVSIECQSLRSPWNSGGCDS